MDWDGSGNIVRDFFPEIDRDNNIKILASKFEALFEDIATSLENCYTLDSQTSPTQNLDMNGKKIVNVGNGTSNEDLVTFSQLEERVEKSLSNNVKYTPKTSFTGDERVFLDDDGVSSKSTTSELRDYNTPLNYFEGGLMSNNIASPSTIMDISAGKARSSDDTKTLIIPANSLDITNASAWADGIVPNNAIAQYTLINGANYVKNGVYIGFDGTDDYAEFPLGATDMSGAGFDYHVSVSFDVMGTEMGITGLNSDTEEFIQWQKDPSNNLRIWLSSNGTSWDIMNNVSGIKSDWSINTQYDFRLYHTGTEWKLDWSDDGKDIDDGTKTWTNDITVASALTLNNPTARTMTVGAEFFGSNFYLNGNIYLANTRLKVGATTILEKQIKTPTNNGVFIWIDDNDDSPRYVLDDATGSNLVTYPKRLAGAFITDINGDIIPFTTYAKGSGYLLVYDNPNTDYNSNSLGDVTVQLSIPLGIDLGYRGYNIMDVFGVAFAALFYMNGALVGSNRCSSEGSSGYPLTDLVTSDATLFMDIDVSSASIDLNILNTTGFTHERTL
jgi:hypothetical protein